MAKARNTSMRALIEEFAATALTADELRERVGRTTDFLEEEFGHRISQDESDDLRERMRQAQAARTAQVKTPRTGRDAAA
nr:hypothetical protein [Streptomyces sp. SID14478]